MIHYLKHQQINKSKWDQCIAQSPQHLPYGYSWYLDIACEHWDALVLNDYEALMPLPFKKKFGIHMIYQPFFTQQLGVFGNANSNDFLQNIPDHFRHIHINLNYQNNTISTNKFGIREENNLVLETTFDTNEKIFTDHCRRNIKKAGNFSLELHPCEENKLITLFRKNRGKYISHLREQHYQTLEQLISVCKQRNMAEIIGVYSKKQELLGGAVFISCKNRRIFYFSATSGEGKKCHVLYYLFSQVILNRKSENIKWDFEGSNDAGLSRFYRGFGAKSENYFSIHKNRLAFPLRLFKK